MSLGLPGMPDIIVSSEQRGDNTIIDVKAKEGTGLAKRLPFASDRSPQQAPTIDIVCSKESFQGDS